MHLVTHQTTHVDFMYAKTVIGEKMRTTFRPVVTWHMLRELSANVYSNAQIKHHKRAQPRFFEKIFSDYSGNYFFAGIYGDNRRKYFFLKFLGIYFN